MSSPHLLPKFPNCLAVFTMPLLCVPSHMITCRRIRVDGYLRTPSDGWNYYDNMPVSGPALHLLEWAMDEALAVPFHMFADAVIAGRVKGAVKGGEASQRDPRGGGIYRALIEKLGVPGTPRMLPLRFMVAVPDTASETAMCMDANLDSC